MTSGEVTEDRIIKGMVGRDLEHRYPDRTPNIGEELLRDRGLDGPPPAATTTASWSTTRTSTSAPGEIVGLAGLMGAGRTELAMSVFGRTYGTRHHRARCSSTARRSRPARCREAIDHGIAYATEDRKLYGLNLIEDIKRNISMAALGKLAKRRLGRRQRGVPRSPTATARA